MALTQDITDALSLVRWARSKHERSPNGENAQTVREAEELLDSLLDGMLRERTPADAAGRARMPSR